MACQWREKPGLDPACKTLVAAGQQMCPRHLYLEGVRENERLEKERRLLVEKKIVKRNPTNRRELLEQGYQAIGNGTCSKCQEPVQWFRTPNGNRAPYNPMESVDAAAVSHFATCKYASAFKRAS